MSGRFDTVAGLVAFVMMAVYAFGAVAARGAGDMQTAIYDAVWMVFCHQLGEHFMRRGKE